MVRPSARGKFVYWRAGRYSDSMKRHVHVESMRLLSTKEGESFDNKNPSFLQKSFKGTGSMPTTLDRRGCGR
jgi:hypothetical protein